MKAKISYRPRVVIKRIPDTLDPEEVGVAFDKLNHAYYICPPDMSPASSQVLIERWIVFLNFVDLIPTFEKGESWLENLAPHIVDSYYQAKERFHIDNSEKDTY